MFVTQKMVLLDVLVLQKDIEDVSKLIVEAGYFEPSSYSSMALQTDKQWIQENTAEKKKLISNLLKEAQDLQHFFDPQNKFEVPDTQKEVVYTIPMMGDTIRQYITKKNQLEERSARIRKQKEDIAVKIAGLKMHMNTTAKHSTSKIGESKDLYSNFGLITTGNLAVLRNEFHRFGGELLTEGHVNDLEIVFITVPRENKTELTALLEQLYFVNYGLPEEFFGEGSSNMMRLGLDFTLVCDQEDMLESEIKKLKPAVLTNLKDILSSLDLYSKISDIRQSMKQAGHFVLLSGWITASNFRKFKKDLAELCGDNYEITVTDTDSFRVSVDIPTKLDNPKIFKPFEQLVTTFGMPNYKEIDPTIIFGALYIFMYGAMFGDVGQGAIIFLGGLLGLILGRKSSFGLIFGLMVWVGMSSMIFGVLYGSYFGYEKLAGYDWVPDAMWMSPMHNINDMLLYAILFGVGVISFSYVLGIVNCLRMKDFNGLIFSHKGLTAFVVYLILLSMVYCFVFTIPIPIIVYVVLGALSLFLGLERVWDALFFGHGSIKDWWMGFFDMFEFFLSILTNTLSFVRIGAFTLTHAALMMAIFTLRDLAGGDTISAYVTVVFGNLFVVVVEGFIVGIQTLRLEYYEFFLRFFKGTGRTFKPIEYK